MTIDVNNLTFGVEIETAIPVGVDVCVGGYHCGNSVSGLPEGWKAEYDSSICAPSGHRPCEFVSPVLRGAEGIRQIKVVCDWLNSIGAKVNRSTGFHVHVGWTGDEKSLKVLTTYVSNFEKALYASSGTHSRETGHFCRGIQSDRTYVAKFRNGQSSVPICNRYHVLNLTNLGHGMKNTVEFRVFSGTTNATKAIGYVRLCLGIVEKALRSRRTPNWVGKKAVETSPLFRKGGEGQTELTRLFYSLGWIKGDQEHLFGDIHPDDVPTLEETKKELMRLAKKYDGGIEDAQTV
jgi:hypothetical protein